MTITPIDHGEGHIVGFKVSGDVTRDDYAALTPAVADAVDRYGSVRMLLDLTGFHWEKVSAWGSDLRFGREFHDRIDRMAIVGDKRWEKHLASLCAPFYAKEARYFDSETDGWEWLED